jgi:hypothetical protein
MVGGFNSFEACMAYVDRIELGSEVDDWLAREAHTEDEGAHKRSTLRVSTASVLVDS